MSEPIRHHPECFVTNSLEVSCHPDCHQVRDRMNAAKAQEDRESKEREAQNYLLDWATYHGPRRADGSVPTDLLVALSRVAFPGFTVQQIERLLWPK